MLSTVKPVHPNLFADKVKMQHRLFAELSRMFGREVPLYDKSLLVNKVCNSTVCSMLEEMYKGFSVTDEQLDKTSGERHGAIRIGTPDEYRWVAGYFAAFAMEPHNFYDMTTLGGKSQPIIATAFRSTLNPEHRVFCSLLMVDSFDETIRSQVQNLLADRQVFSARTKELILKNDTDGGLDEAEAEELVHEGTNRIFKWTGQARNYKLYNELSGAGLKIAADIACFNSHHLNHLTPNTFCMDLYTSAMKYCLGELDRATFQSRAAGALKWLCETADQDYMKLQFRYLTIEEIQAFTRLEVTEHEIQSLAEKVTQRLSEPDLDLKTLNHAGFKDFTEGPDTATPVLLRQDSYKALTEPVTFHEADGSTVEAVHTARFGEIEQRFYATTSAGRGLYDKCLASADTEREKKPGLAKENYAAYLAMYEKAFLAFPKTLPELLDRNLVFGRYFASPKGIGEADSNISTDINDLMKQGYVNYEGLRYEDFLPFSAAGIFASNLGQHGSASHAKTKPVYCLQTLEEIMGRTIINPNIVYAGIQSESVLEVYSELGLRDKVSHTLLAELEQQISAYKNLISDI